MNTYYKILNEIAAAFDMDQWDEQVNPFTDAINEQLKPFVHDTKYEWIYILEYSSLHDFPQFDFYKKRCYINGEKVELDILGKTENKWKDQKTVNVIIEDLNQLGKYCNFMFFSCHSLVSVPWFDTNKVTNMKRMFMRCESLVSVPLFDTSRVTDMNEMFFNCPSLSEKTIQDWSSIYNFLADKMK